MYNEETKTGEARRAARSEERHKHTTVQVPAKAASRADGTRDAARTCERTHGGRRDPDPGAKIGATAGGASAEPGTEERARAAQTARVQDERADMQGCWHTHRPNPPVACSLAERCGS